MARTKSEFNPVKYKNQFNKENYDRIEFVVPKGRKQKLKQIAAAANQSMSEYINQAINERIERDLRGKGNERN